MEERPRALLLKFPGTNCDGETRRALVTAGFNADTVPIRSLTADRIFAYALIVIPGGFSYGDYVMAGKLAQLELEKRIGSALREFRDNGGLILGICNGFQILMRMGLLPEGSLIQNENRRFICSWVRVRVQNRKSPFLYLVPPTFELPIAHAEGRFVSRPGLANRYVESGLAALIYEENLNGSEGSIAGLSDTTGRVFGLMPHPERYVFAEDHYAATLNPDGKYGVGYGFFRSAGEYLKAQNINRPVAAGQAC